MNRGLLVVGVMAAALFVSTGASAKDWFASCTVKAAGTGGTKYVGGTANKAHLHVGSNFIDDTRNPTGQGGRYTTDFPKKQLTGKCTALTTWMNAVHHDSSQYEVGADVAACLGHFKSHIGCP